MASSVKNPLTREGAAPQRTWPRGVMAQSQERRTRRAKWAIMGHHVRHRVEAMAELNEEAAETNEADSVMVGDAEQPIK